MISRIFSPLCVAPLLALVACTGNTESSLSPDADSAEITAAIAVATTSYADERTPAHTTAVARFIRSQGSIDAPTLRMLGAAPDLPPVGTCALASHDVTDAVPSTGSRAVELMDVGRMVIAAGDRVSVLAPRRIPDVTDLIAGVVYSARADGSDALVSGSISLRTTGNEFIGPLTVDVASIAAPADVTFDGQLASASLPLPISGNGDVTVTWAATEKSSAVADVVTFEINSSGETIVCGFGDDGSAILRSALFASGAGTISIHRIHREPVLAHGIDQGEARFDAARVYDFVAP